MEAHASKVLGGEGSGRDSVLADVSIVVVDDWPQGAPLLLWDAGAVDQKDEIVH